MALLSSPYSFTPTVGTTGTGSYNTQDWLSLLTGLTTGGVAGTGAAAGINEQIGQLRSLGAASATDYANLAKQVTQGTQFTPYTLTNALGTVKQTAPGVISQQLTPQQQANVNAASAMQGSLYGAAVPNTTAIQQQAFGGIGGYLNTQGNQQLQNLSGMFGNIAQQAGKAYGAPTGLERTTAQALQGASAGLGSIGSGLGGLTGLQNQYTQQAAAAAKGLGGSTQSMADQLFATQQAMVTPEQQRQQLELENRLRAQGRLGTTTAAYGGTPEQLAMAKAVEEQRASSAYGALTNAEAMATSQQARALGLGQAASGMAQNISGLTNDQQARALGLLSAGQQGTTLQDQLLSSQLSRAGTSAQQASTLAAANQALKQGDIATATSLFNIGSSAAQLPGNIQAQNVSTAGALQSQALAPSAQQLEQAQLSASLGQQNASANLDAGTLFGNLASTGLQERLTAETAAAALRGKQYESQLSALASQGGQTGTAANTVQNLLNQGIQKVGGNLVDATGKVLGTAADLIGTAASNLFDSLGAGGILDTNTQFEKDWAAAMAGNLTSADTPSVIQEGWDAVKSWFGW